MVMDLIQSANPLLLSFFQSCLKRNLTVFRRPLLRKCFHPIGLNGKFNFRRPSLKIMYNVSDISIVILKNLIFNENEIKAGRILTFFPTKTIQV